MVYASLESGDSKPSSNTSIIKIGSQGEKCKSFNGYIPVKVAKANEVFRDIYSIYEHTHVLLILFVT